MPSLLHAAVTIFYLWGIILGCTYNYGMFSLETCKGEKRRTCDDKSTLVNGLNELYCSPNMMRVTFPNIGNDKQLFIRQSCCPNLSKLMVKVGIECPTVITDNKEQIVQLIAPILTTITSGHSSYSKFTTKHQTDPIASDESIHVHPASKQHFIASHTSQDYVQPTFKQQHFTASHDSVNPTSKQQHFTVSHDSVNPKSKQQHFTASHDSVNPTAALYCQS
ncbi:unnamed protein product [Mytilus coruscus]|uniref:Uncharacterized protein n=1 Tax=Mytilus coruscus TaxID=42192 RepID=A0A6J8AZZ3_MYTCO|nr:unnamed protein product [Mytilus coruscus]